MIHLFVTVPASLFWAQDMEQIEIKFTEKERHLILYHTFADPYLTKRLRIAEIKGKYLITKRNYWFGWVSGV